MKYVILITLLLSVVVAPIAKANLLVSPTRVTFDDKERVRDVVLINTTNNTRSYRIGWQETKADELGRYTKFQDQTTPWAASPFIRYSPRQVVLKPGERQVIKLMLRRKANMELAEYRSHLAVTALPSSSEQANNDVKEGVEFKINVLTSYTLPVIVRTGGLDAEVAIQGLEVNVDNDKAFFKVELSKKGDTSINGDLKVYLTEANGTESLVGLLTGVTVFHENQQRISFVPWKDYLGPRTGQFRVEYIGADDLKGQTISQFQSDLGISDFKPST